MKIIVLMAFISGFIIYPEMSSAKNSEKAEKMMVDLSPNQPVHKLFALTILSINGKPIAHKNHFIMLEAGEYTLKFTANVKFKYLPGNEKILRSRIDQRKYSDTLILRVEANKKYQLAFDARPAKVEDWKPILLTVTEQ